ncbi:flavin-containing monooxygenase [Nocardia jiangxiensis]|uniref:Flavin-containing monooxygenase n=1 Tax=Nocardia jiangxiensis TaxID=282685 RepID=A0ABW6SFZ4_9NOCA|nr:NAD(P)/FAD-dependent oxidoreductase [Nocardia jiangxiensis]
MSDHSDVRTAATSDTAVDFDAIIVGAGFAGIRTLYELRERGLTALVIEAASDIGGTWFWNRYPGARTDSEAWVYAYCFSKDLMNEWNWSERYPSQPEVERYLRLVVDKFDMRKDMMLNTHIESAVFDEGSETWVVSIEGGAQIRSRFIVTGLGHLSKPYRPPFPSLESFRGEWYQTSRYPSEGVDFTGKRVAVIGTGATGVQLTPLVAETAAHVTVFQRTPNWVLPARNHPLDDAAWREIRADYDGIWQKVFSQNFALPYGSAHRVAADVSAQEQQAILEHGYEIGHFQFLFETFDDILTDETTNELVCDFLRSKIRETVKDPATAEILCPKYPLLAKRPPLGHFYYEAFNRDNVSLVDVSDNPLVDVTEGGLRTADAEYEADIIVFATGFDAVTGAYLTLDIVGRDGVHLHDKWKDGPRTNLGEMVDGFPNLFLASGPHQPFANIPAVIDRSVRWIGRAITQLLEDKQTIIEADVDAVDKWTDLMPELLARTIFAKGMGVHAWHLGSNIPGKPVVVMAYHGGANNYFAALDDEAEAGFPGFIRR